MYMNNEVGGNFIGWGSFIGDEEMQKENARKYWWQFSGKGWAFSTEQSPNISSSERETFDIYDSIKYV